MKKFQFLFILSIFSLPVFSIHAQSVDLIWQGDGYTPPFYQGKALWPKQSKITLVAVPQGLGNPNNLNYKWTKSGTVLGNFNGVGKHTLFFLDTILSRSQTIKVEVISGQKIVASATVFVQPSSPQIVVYENNPLYGFMFHKEVGKIYNFLEQEVTFAMFPFFVSASGRTDNVLKYEWKTNGKTTATSSLATYRIPENTSGSSKIEVGFSNTDKITQRAGKSFLVQFESQ